MSQRKTKKTSSSRKKSTRKKTKASGKLDQVYILGEIFFILLVLVSLHSQSAGIIGSALKNAVLTLFGFGGYILPYILIGLVLTQIFKRSKLKKISIALAVGYIGLISILDISAFTVDQYETIVDKLVEASEIGRTGLGGGAIGGSLAYMNLKLIGRLGAILLNITIILGAIIVISDRKLGEILKDLSGLIKRIYIGLSGGRSKEKPKKKSAKSQNTKRKDKGDFKILESTEDLLEVTQDIGTQDEKNKKLKLDSKEDIDKSEVSQETGEDDKSFEDSIIRESKPYRFPPVSFLSEKKEKNGEEKGLVKENAKKLIDTLANFGVDAEIDQVSIGPSITQYELKIAAGVKVSRIVNLSNDIALSLASSDIRIEAPIPGKSAIGIEVPNKHKTGVNLREIICSRQFKETESKIAIALGKSVEGQNIVADIQKMPHLLIAGATGSGKSVCINTIITSILYNASPEEVKLILIDPKVVELSVYNGIPHLLTPVVTDPKKAPGALNWAVEEMNKRYNLFADSGVRDIGGYNKKQEKSGGELLPKIVIIIDELSDLMMVASSEMEELICRIAQMARAAGIHLILATQRPSVDVITGTIKANIPSRISFAVSSQTDSRTILDMGGAEKLLGRGDMLYYPSGESKPSRIQGAFIDDDEVETIVEFIKSNSQVEFKEELVEELEREIEYSEDCDELLPKAIEVVVNDGQASASLLQRRLKVGYARAARIIDQMEERGIVEGHQGSKPRKVLVEKENLE